jgi:lambda repressor-like predicted transcriptional regulator
MRRLVLLLTAVLTVAVSGTALAAQATREKPRSGVAVKQQRGLVGAAAGYLGLSQAQVRAQLRSGKSLAQIATADGKSVEGLKAALLATFKAKVAAAQAAGRIDAAKAERLLGRAPAIVERLVMRTPKARGDRVRLRGGMLKVAANYVGFTPKQLVYELRSGTSLAQVATARGKSVAGLEAALFSAFKAKVDAAVVAGRLDRARAQKLLESAPAHIARIVNRTRG